jgi:RNA polymerase sigma-70 factor (ECF subfamily)
MTTKVKWAAPYAERFVLGIRRKDMEGIGARPLHHVVSRESAFKTFAEQQLAEQYRIAALILGDREEAEDATHDALELAWRRWPSLRNPDRLEAWFGRILVNVCRDRLRRRRRRPITDLSNELARSMAYRDDITSASDRDDIRRAFASLSADQRVVIVLRFYADLSIDQIAERVGVPAGTVKSRIHYALQDLNRALRAEGIEECRP